VPAQQLWGKAKSYLNDSLKIEPDPATLGALARLAEAVGDVPRPPPSRGGARLHAVDAGVRPTPPPLRENALMHGCAAEQRGRIASSQCVAGPKMATAIRRSAA
jgi:hypothetical protein